MDSANAQPSIIVDFDVIFDTRAAMAIMLDHSGVTKFIESGKYHQRVRDNMGKISFEIFHAFYKKRMKTLIKHAVPTPMMMLIKELLEDEIASPRNAEIADDIKLYVNMYPYRLTERDISAMKNLLEKIYGEDNVVLVNLSLDELDIDWVSNHVGTIIKYDIVEWLERIMNNYRDDGVNMNFHNIQELVLRDCIGPAIFNSHIPTKAITPDYIEQTTKLFNTICNLQLAPATMFSMAIPELNDKSSSEKDVHE